MFAGKSEHALHCGKCAFRIGFFSKAFLMRDSGLAQRDCDAKSVRAFPALNIGSSAYGFWHSTYSCSMHEKSRDAEGIKGGTMLKSALFMGAITLLGATLPAISTPKYRQQRDAQRSLNLVGQIMDSRCAIDGSHEKMMGQNGTKNAKECTLQCAKTGGSFVLFDPETKTVYQLDDQQKPVRFAGQRVRISGMYDEPSKTMHIESIESAD
jgi:hypothetical protein